MSESNGTMRARRPQLNDSIEKLDEMITDLSVAIPGAVAESVREALGPAFAAAITAAVTAAVAEALKSFAPTAAQPAPVAPRPPVTPREPRAGAWTKVKAALGRLRRWAARTAAPVVAEPVHRDPAFELLIAILALPPHRIFVVGRFRVAASAPGAKRKGFGAMCPPGGRPRRRQIPQGEVGDRQTNAT